jgi:hypothetical protein
MAETVVVYCKIPNGLHLTVKDAAGLDVTIRVNGPANRVGESPSCVIVAGFASTTIPKDHWDAWAKSHSGYEPFKKGHIFATGKPENGAAQAKDNRLNLTGLEPINPLKPGNGVQPDEDWLKKNQKKIQAEA